MSPSLTNGGFIHDLPCLQVVAHLGILHQLCNCPQGTEHGLQYPDQHSWHAVIFNYKYKKNQIICLSVCKATSCHWSWHCDSCSFPAIINYSKMHQIQYNLTILLTLISSISQHSAPSTMGQAWGLPTECRLLFEIVNG